MPTFAAQVAPDTSKIRSARQRARLAAKIAADGELVTVTRRNDTDGQAAYAQTIPALVRMLALSDSDISLEGVENMAQAEPMMFTFEGGWDINEATDKIVWPAGSGISRRIAHCRRHPVQGQVTGIYALALRE